MHATAGILPHSSTVIERGKKLARNFKQSSDFAPTQNLKDDGRRFRLELKPQIVVIHGACMQQRNSPERYIAGDGCKSARAVSHRRDGHGYHQRKTVFAAAIQNEILLRLVYKVLD